VSLICGHENTLGQRRGDRRGFSLPELLVVIGIVTLLLAIILPPIMLARRQALATRCGTQLQQIGLALESTYTEYRYYPFWDDGGSSSRYTWMDVLVQSRQLESAGVGYCPEGRPPSAAALGAVPQGSTGDGSDRPGIEYSYGIGVPLSAGGWNWYAGFAPPGDDRPRRFENHERHTAQRVLAGDSNWTSIYNLTGYTLLGHDLSFPTQYDNTIEWRHRGRSANLLFQDGHVARVFFRPDLPEPINTANACLWYPGEPVQVGPDDEHNGNWYPDVPPVNLSGDLGGAIPRELIPRYYTANLLWTQVRHR
jgi:prepilin-type N-terminal cleavage/methylation domain-containing protein/prepilin-type processing-associated H-X9-DG protein